MKATLVLSAVALIGGVASGWQINQWRWEAKWAEMQTSVIQTYEAKQKQLNLEFAAQQEKDTAARLALSRTLQDSRKREADLIKELESVQLIKPDTQIQVERVVETVTMEVEGECVATQTVIANPFSDDFVRVWNESANSIDAGSTPTE